MFHYGVVVDSNSKLEKYNVIFNNTTICNSSMGDHTYIQRNSSILNCAIGKFCSIGPNVNIGLGQHPIERVSTHPAFYSITQPLAVTFATGDTFEPYKPIAIGNDVWIGHSSLIMDGVKIGNGAVIAANSVVTTDVPPYAIAGGVPAKVIRYRFDNETIRKIDGSQWWNEPEEWLRKNCTHFESTEEFLKRII